MVPEQTLPQGSWYALEQTGRLLRSAVVLFESGDPSTAVAVAMFGREELGRSRILRVLAQQGKTQRCRGQEVVQGACDEASSCCIRYYSADQRT